MDYITTKFKLWKEEVDDLSRRKIKYLRSNNGIKYIDFNFQKMCAQHNIYRHFLVRKTPQQNCVVERMNMPLSEREKCLWLNVGFSKGFWEEGINLTLHFITKSPQVSWMRKVQKCYEHVSKWCLWFMNCTETNHINDSIQFLITTLIKYS